MVADPQPMRNSVGALRIAEVAGLCLPGATMQKIKASSRCCFKNSNFIWAATGVILSPLHHHVPGKSVGSDRKRLRRRRLGTSACKSKKGQ